VKLIVLERRLRFAVFSKQNLGRRLIRILPDWHATWHTSKAEIHGGLAFYTDFYQRKSAMDWATAKYCAEQFIPMLEKDWPEYIEEMKGWPRQRDSSHTILVS
jgi:hypothetical protein